MRKIGIRRTADPRSREDPWRRPGTQLAQRERAEPVEPGPAAARPV